MQEFVDAVDGLPTIVKYLFCIPVLSIIWIIYRICRSAAHGNGIGVIIGVLLIIIGLPFMWLFDLLCLVFTSRVLWID